MFSSNDRLLISWNTRPKEIPPRPRNPLQFPPTDARHWYDQEYAGWRVQKCGIPDSPGNGSRGKRVAFLSPDCTLLCRVRGGPREDRRARGSHRQHPYGHDDDGEPGRAGPPRPGGTPRPRDSGSHKLGCMHPMGPAAPCPRRARDREQLHPQRRGLSVCPGLVRARTTGASTACWLGASPTSGPPGRIRHRAPHPGTSCYDARRWSVVTELAVVAPRCDASPWGRRAGREPSTPRGRTRLVTRWLAELGGELRGIVGPDDDILVDGINEALRRAGREDIVRVGAGSTQKGMALVKGGQLHAITFQPAQADGALGDEDRRGLVQRAGHPAHQLPAEAHHHPRRTWMTSSPARNRSSPPYPWRG